MLRTQLPFRKTICHNLTVGWSKPQSLQPTSKHFFFPIKQSRWPHFPRVCHELLFQRAFCSGSRLVEGFCFVDLSSILQWTMVWINLNCQASTSIMSTPVKLSNCSSGVQVKWLPVNSECFLLASGKFIESEVQHFWLKDWEKVLGTIVQQLHKKTVYVCL